jgi:hypothetical protein
VRFAQQTKISFTASEKFFWALELAKAGNEKALLDLGLSLQDYAQLGRREPISEQGIQGLSKNLNVSSETARQMIHQLIAEFRVQAKDQNSSYWKSCFQKGKWKTYERDLCTHPGVKGCSPTTGATACMAL